MFKKKFIACSLMLYTIMLSSAAFMSCNNDDNDPDAIYSGDTVQMAVPDTSAPVMVDTTLTDSMTKKKQGMKKFSDTGKIKRNKTARKKN